jgi:hypothetical protein
MQLLPVPVHNGDERAGYPSASEYDRLLACRASYLLSQRNGQGNMQLATILGHANRVEMFISLTAF